MTLTRLAAIVVIALSIFTFAVEYTSAQPTGTIIDVEQAVGSSGKADWTTGVITAVGIGTPPVQSANTGQARAAAERDALAFAYRNLLDALKAVRVDANTSVENFMGTSDVIRTEVNGFIQGAMIMDKKYMNDGFVEVAIGMRLSGALSDALLPKTASPQTTITSAPTDSHTVVGQVYSGLIIDARGLGVRPAMAPKILNEDGKEVYGPARTNRDLAVRDGVARYMRDPAAAQSNERVKDKPLMVKALKVSGDARVDLVISNADAVSLQNASQNMSMLEKCRVIILMD